MFADSCHVAAWGLRCTGINRERGKKEGTIMGRVGHFATSAALGILSVVGMTAEPGRAATVYVNGMTGDDAWSGWCYEWGGETCGPKATIQAAIDAAADGDTVLIADGTYTGAGATSTLAAGCRTALPAQVIAVISRVTDFAGPVQSCER